jgi:hypothetical protein
MYIQYGNYRHAIGEGALSVSQQAEYESGIPAAIRVRFEVQGRIQIADQGSPLANQAFMTAALDDLEAAYLQNGLDFGLYQDDGTPTQHVLLNAATLGGTRVITPVSYPVGRGAEYSTYRNYTVSIEGLLPNFYASIVQWKETLTFNGGGPEFIFLQTLNGLPQKQVLYQQTTYKASQRGSAVGNLAYPLPPDPLWPYAIHPNRTVIDRSSPERVGTTGIAFRHYQTTWSYSFEDVAPLVGDPNYWGNG